MRGRRQILIWLRASGLEAAARGAANRQGVALERAVLPSRERAITTARHAIWAAIYGHPGWTFRRIAHLFGVDETTVCDGVDAHLNRQKRCA